MAIRIHEMHPAIVHVPIALLPVSVGADLLGQVAGEQLFSFGRKAMLVAAVGAVGAGISGLIAGEEVNVEGRSRDMLMTHRNLNVVAMLAVTAWRFGAAAVTVRIPLILAWVSRPAASSATLPILGEN